MLESLNAEYSRHINNDQAIDDAYAKMVASRTMRVLSKHDYNQQGIPYRSARCAEEPKDTDVSKIISPFRIIFCQQIVNFFLVQQQ